MAVDITIADRGDIIFKLGKEGETTTKVLVSSHVMSFASPVFQAMFNGGFAEGQARSPDAPREIPLPDDDLNVMLLMCKIAHLKNSDLPEELSVDDFAELVTTCDKYQCCEAVKAWSKVWAAKIFQQAPGPDFEKVILATYIHDLPDEFYKATTILARDREIDAKINSSDHNAVAIFQTVQANKRKAETLLYVGIGNATVDLCECVVSQMTFGQFMLALRNVDIWPIRPKSISQTKHQVALMASVTHKPCGNHYCTCKWAYNLTEVVVSRVESVYDAVQGVCLDCIKRQHQGVLKSCRVNHEGMQKDGADS